MSHTYEGEKKRPFTPEEENRVGNVLRRFKPAVIEARFSSFDRMVELQISVFGYEKIETVTEHEGIDPRAGMDFGYFLQMIENAIRLVIKNAILQAISI